MTEMSQLWLPILLSAVLVFVASSVLHMALPWHKNDFLPLPREADFRAVVGPLSLPPGDYLVPRAMNMEEMKSPEFAEKLNQGPVVLMTVLPSGPFNMGRNLGLWFLYCAVMSVFAAYIASRALAPGADYLEVFRFAGATAFIGYSAALWQHVIWYQRSWATTLRSTVDGLIYGLLTAGVMGWLWP
jgi:hypothetical protein